jgi:hypothetical protein
MGEKKHLKCENCKKDIASTHCFITGEEGYEILPHFKLAITSPVNERTWIFCDFDCLVAWFKKQFVPGFEHETPSE